ncbi:MAG: hypothetical protein HC845_03850 [Akkermansiaceae bacterium]|nr:hypothetical protein [Akkermansiaceae bacterium]
MKQINVRKIVARNGKTQDLVKALENVRGKLECKWDAYNQSGEAKGFMHFV